MARREETLSEAPLLAWGDARQALKLERRRIVKRASGVLVLTALLLGSAVVPPRPRLVWNASASAPLGLYAIQPGASLARGDMALASLPRSVRTLAARRRYLPANVPLVKRVAAVAGTEICAHHREILIDNRVVAMRRIVDRRGRHMPSWEGCVRLRNRQLFLLMAHNPDSFDGRYFGPTDGTDVIGRARLLWAR